MADNKPTLHNLNHSQSQRILWLLEELNIDYDLVNHERNPANHPTRPFLSPPSLLAVSTYGKAPFLTTGRQDGNRPVSESSAIATYLIRTFDTSDRFGLRMVDWIRDEMLVSMVSIPLARSAFLMFMLDTGILRNGEGPAGERFDGPEMRNILKQFEELLEQGPEGGFFMGKEPGRADILAEFPISMIKHREWLDLEKEFPELDEWLARVYARPAFKRALEKGKGYDYTVFPKRPLT